MSTTNPNQLIISLILVILLQVTQASWDQWWTYDGISGPDFWGLLNPKWSHCNKGRRQSPLDINPDLLLFDPGLSPITVNGDHIKGQLVNTGRGLQFKVSANSTITISGGPLSYEYSLSHMLLHYGREDDRGSEHTISGSSFPGELQLHFFNSQLHGNWSEAADQPNGLAAIAVLVQVTGPGQEGNSQLKHVFHAVESIKSKGTEAGSSARVHKLAIGELLPALKHYMTYEGSLTQPACFETVTWLLLNRPIYATSSELAILRNAAHLDVGQADNFRPTQPPNFRSVRTNIMFGENGNQTRGPASTSGSGTLTTSFTNFNTRKSCSGRSFMQYKG